jgi:transcriptional regulator with AAA-type ATPase domain
MPGRVRPSRSRDTSLRTTAPRDASDGGNGAAAFREPPPAHRFLRYFPDAEVEAIAAIVTEIASRKAEFIEQWKDLYASTFGPHRECSDLLFRDTYVPHLRSAVLRLAGGDPDGFVQFATLLGEQLADGGTSFALLVAHLDLLKQSCVRLLAGSTSQGLEATVDKLTACCISAAAESYHRHLVRPRSRAPGASRNSPPLPRAWMFHGMVGRSEAMQALFERIRNVAGSGASVLVVGEAGTGKELVARAVHACGTRLRRPFVAVDCAALPRELTESEILGYVRGALSGAANRPGAARAAGEGTLLLDDITAMSPQLQATLLRAFHERADPPLGARVIASTRCDPSAAVASGAFRGDLCDWLAAARIDIPPLREHREDIVPLVEHRLVELNERYARMTPGVRGITADAMGELQSRPWPGNVRELFEAVAQGFAAAHELHIRLCDLPSETPDAQSMREDRRKPTRRRANDQKRYAFSAESSSPTSSVRTRLPRP